MGKIAGARHCTGSHDILHCHKVTEQKKKKKRKKKPVSLKDVLDKAAENY